MSEFYGSVNEGLLIAKASNPEQLERAVAALKQKLKEDVDASGVVVLSPELAARQLGPVRADWLDAGISLHRSSTPDLDRGAKALLNEYKQMLGESDAGEAGMSFGLKPLPLR